MPAAPLLHIGHPGVLPALQLALLRLMHCLGEAAEKGQAPGIRARTCAGHMLKEEPAPLRLRHGLSTNAHTWNPVL